MGMGGGPVTNTVDISGAAGERFLFSGRLEIVGGWGCRSAPPLPSTPLE